MDIFSYRLERDSCQRGASRRAAESVSRLAVSKAIADLESALGVRLVYRSSHGVVPTVFGQSQLKRGAAIFDELQRGAVEMDFLADRDARPSQVRPYARSGPACSVPMRWQAAGIPTAACARVCVASYAAAGRRCTAAIAAWRNSIDLRRVVFPSLQNDPLRSAFLSSDWPPSGRIARPTILIDGGSLDAGRADP